MKRAPRPKQNDTVNRAELARMIGVSLPTIDDWQRRGCPVVETGSKGRSYSFNVQAVIEWRVTDERRRQGMPSVLPITDAGKPAYNPLRALAHDAALSYERFIYTQDMIEEMIKAMRKETGCTEQAAKRTVASIFTLQWISLSVWVSGDRFNRELAAKGEGDFDSTVKKMNRSAQFIPGPIPTDKFENGDYTPKAMNALYTELLGSPVED